MSGRMGRLWQQQRLVLVVFGLALCVTLFFAFKTLSSWLYWSDPAHRNQNLEGWMTPRYVSLSYQIPPEVLGPALFLVEDAPMRRATLDQIALENGVTLNDLQARVESVKGAFELELDSRREGRDE